jgi:hypothetical protein
MLKDLALLSMISISGHIGSQKLNIGNFIG